MQRPVKKLCAWTLILSVLLTTGCQPMQPYYLHDDGGDLTHYLDVATEIEYTDVCQEPLAEVSQAHAPRTISRPKFDEFWDLKLEDAVQIALQNSKIIRSLGPLRQFGQVIGGIPERLLSSPSSLASVFDPAIQETGQSGVEQALATFDAIFSSTTTWDNTDRNQNFAQGVVSQARIFQQDNVNIQNEVSKLAANGTQWFFRNISTYSGSNNAVTAATRQVPSDWFTAFETEFRHPVLRNRGTQVNRIPVVLARMRTDVSLIDFEQSVAEFLNGVERAYWELYFFYHQLRAAQDGRDSAQASWQKVNALYQAGSPGGEAEKEAQAREQYYFFQDRLEQAQRDLFKSASKLRYYMGLTPTDNRLIRPVDKPTAAKIEFDWNLVTEEAAARNPALRREAWQVRQREMELIAARNQLLPQLDIVALYRWLGQGDNWNSNKTDLVNNPGPIPYPNSAVGNLWDGNNQEFRLGFDFNMPLGLRREMSQVRSSELALARERARYEEAELELVHGLTDAIQELDAAYHSVNTNFNRRIAAEQQVVAIQAAYIAGTAPLDQVLDAQRRQADATVSYYQALINHNLNILTIHLRKGSIFEYCGVMLGEGPWPAKAYFDAANHARRRDASHYLNYGYSRPNVVSRGPVSERWKGDSQLALDDAGDYDPEPMADEADDLSTDDENTQQQDSDDPFSDDDGAMSKQLDEAIDSLNDDDELPMPPEPRMPKSPMPPAEAEPLPLIPNELENDDLEASRRVRTARRRPKKPIQRDTKKKNSQPQAGGISIRWEP